MSGAEYLTQDDDIDVAGAFAALRRRWWLVALVTILAGAGLFFGLSTLDPKYQSDARILIQDGNNVFTRATSDNNIQNVGNQLDQQAIRSEVEIVSSNKLALQVIDELNLAENEEFNGDADSPGFMDLLAAMLGQATKSSGDIWTYPEKVEGLSVKLRATGGLHEQRKTQDFYRGIQARSGSFG